jgi:hypothetical protein
MPERLSACASPSLVEGYRRRVISGNRSTLGLPARPRGSFWSIGVLTVVTLGIGLVVALPSVVRWDYEATYEGVPYVRLYDHPQNGFEAKLNQGDGQAFAALAQDPLLQRPEVFRAGDAEAAYRAQRPLLGWLVWAATLGQAGAVPIAMFVSSLLGLAALAAVMAWMLIRRGASVLWAFVAVLSPGALVTVDWTGPEGLGTAAALLGTQQWIDRRRATALVGLVAAGLLRESLLLVPVAIAAHALVVRRDALRTVLPLAAPIGVFAVWVGIVWTQIGALPSDAGQGRLAAPFTGLFEATRGWDLRDLVMAVLLLGIGVAAIAVNRRDPAAWVAATFAVASFAFGSEVWRRVEDFGRILLPIAAFGALAVAPRYERRRRRSSAAAPGPIKVPG